MKHFILILTIWFSSTAFAVKEGEVLPNVSIDSYSSGKITTEGLKGKVSIINFWATWCEACKVELKEMKTEFSELFKNEKFQFAFVSLDKNPENASDWVKENLKGKEPFTKYLYKDPDFSIAEKLTVDSFPMTFVIDDKGKIRKIQKGFKEGESSTLDMAKLAKSLLDNIPESK